MSLFPNYITVKAMLSFLVVTLSLESKNVTVDGIQLIDRGIMVVNRAQLFQYKGRAATLAVTIGAYISYDTSHPVRSPCTPFDVLTYKIHYTGDIRSIS